MAGGKSSDSPQIFIYHWPTTDQRIGHISIRVGDLYLSHVPKPASLELTKAQTIQTRSNVPTREGKPTPVRKQEAAHGRTFDEDKAHYKNEEPEVIVLSDKHIDSGRVAQFISDMKCGANRNALAPHKPLPHFNPSTMIITEIAPRNMPSLTGRLPKIYYQLCDTLKNVKDIGSSNKDRSNCATMIADCLGSAMSLDKQDVFCAIAREAEPGALMTTIETGFELTREKPPQPSNTPPAPSAPSTPQSSSGGAAT